MRRYFEILVGFLIAGVGSALSVDCVVTVNSLFGLTMFSARVGPFEVTVNNALIFAVFGLGFGLALIYVGGSMAFEDDKHGG